MRAVDYSKEIVLVTNLTDETRKEGFDSELFTLLPGKPTPVPIAAAKNWLGDWDLRNVDAVLRERDWEHDRLKVRWGAYGDPLPTCPYQVSSLDGTAVLTVYEDPEGNSLADTVVSGDVEKQRLETMILEQKRALTALEAQVAARDEAVSLDDIPEDMPGGPDATDRPKSTSKKKKPAELPQGLEDLEV